MNVYLIGNNPRIKDEIIDSLELNVDDLICLFNHQFPLKWNKIRNHKNKIVFVRYHTWQGPGYFGYKEYLKNKELFNKIIFLGNENFYKEKYVDEKSEYFIIDKNSLNYTKDKSPTSGFYGYHYVLNKHENSNIYLVGFDGKGSWWNGHDYIYEQEYYRKNNIKIL